MLVSRVTKLQCETIEKFDETYKPLAAKYPNHLPLLEAKLKWLDGQSKMPDDTRRELVVQLATEIEAAIDTAAMAASLGIKADPDDVQTNKERKELEKMKDTLIDALCRKSCALAALQKVVNSMSHCYAKFADTYVTLA